MNHCWHFERCSHRHRIETLTATIAQLPNVESSITLRTNDFDKLLNFLLVDEKKVRLSGASSHKLVALETWTRVRSPIRTTKKRRQRGTYEPSSHIFLEDVPLCARINDWTMSADASIKARDHVQIYVRLSPWKEWGTSASGRRSSLATKVLATPYPT